MNLTSEQLEALATARFNVLQEINAERARQDGKWGGPEHDDHHTVAEWVQLIQDYAGWARVMGGMNSPDKARRRLMQVAAMAVAAVESMDRAAGVPERETADNWQQYAKEGETAQACIERHRREQDSLLKLLAQAREPLTDQQIISLVPAGWTRMLAQVMEFARRIERARTDGVATDQPNRQEKP